MANTFDVFDNAEGDVSSGTPNPFDVFDTKPVLATSNTFDQFDALAAPAVDPMEAQASPASPTPRQGLPIPESTHPGDLAFKDKLASDAMAKAEKESALQAGARRAAFGTAPTVAGLAGGALGAKGGAMAGGAIGTMIAPGPGTVIGAGIGGLAGAIIGGGGAAIAARKGQDALLESVAPEQMAQWQAEMQAAEQVHPVASFVGDMAPQLIGLKPSFKNVASAFRGAKFLLSGADDVIASPAGRAMMEQLANVGIGAGVEGAQEAYEQYQKGEFNGGRLLARITIAAVVNEPNKFGVRLGLHPSTGEIDVRPPDAALPDGLAPVRAAPDVMPVDATPVKPAIDVPSEIINAPRPAEAVQATAPEIIARPVEPPTQTPVARVEGEGVGERGVTSIPDAPYATGRGEGSTKQAIDKELSAIGKNRETATDAEIETIGKKVDAAWGAVDSALDAAPLGTRLRTQNGTVFEKTGPRDWYEVRPDGDINPNSTTIPRNLAGAENVTPSKPISPPPAEPINAAKATRTDEGVVSSTVKQPKPSAMSRADVVAELREKGVKQTTAYQTRQPTGNADADAGFSKLDKMEVEAAKVVNAAKRPLLRRVRDFVGRNIATINAPVNTRRAQLGSDGLQNLAEKSYIAQQAQQGASSHALDRFNEMTGRWKALKITENDVPELGKYMTAQRSLELYNQVDSGARADPVKSPLTKAEAQAVVNSIESGASGAKMKQAADAARKAFADSLDVLLESGTISRASYDKIKASSRFYFPRAFLDHIDPPTGIIEKTKFGDMQVRQSGVRHIMEGSEGDMLTDPLMLLAQNIAHTETLAAKNRSLNALRDLTEAATPTQKANTDWDMKEIPFDQTARRGYEKVEFWTKGEKKALEVRTDLATALKMVDPGVTSDIAKLARHLSGTSLVKMAATGLNPEFALGNVPRDLGLHYLAGSEYSPILPVAMAQQIKQAAKLTMSSSLRSRLREGFSKYGGGSERLSTSDFLPRPMQSRAYKHSKSIMQNVIGALGYVGNKSEELSRLMLVNQALKNAGTDAFRATPDQWAKAVSIGKEIINFHDAGKLVKALDTVVPFLNPSFQGGRSVARAFKTRPVETTLKAAQIVAAGALMAAWNRRNDDKAWESVSESDKSTKFIIGVNAERKDKDGTTRYGYLGIPVDQGWRPFMILGQMIADKLDGREVDTDLLKKSIGANYIPMDFANLPPVASAMLTYGQNHDFWTGDKVWKGRDVDPVMEQNLSTPSAAVAIGTATGLSPARLTAAGKKLMPSNPVKDLLGGIASVFDNDPGRAMKEDNMVRMAQWPGVRRLFRVTSPRELHKDDINAARRFRIDSRGKPAAQVLNEIDKATVKQNTYRQGNDLKFDKMIAELKAGKITKSDLLRAVQRTKDARGRADIKEIARIRRRLHDRYPALNIPAPRSRNA